MGIFFLEIRYFAKTILYGHELFEEKLIEGKNFTDNTPGYEISAPQSPGRHRALSFENWHKEKKISLPRHYDLEEPYNRAILLHFFANHELLALELMALMLLKFPNAPKAFRFALVKTMQEEQSHLKMYLERMKNLGLSFGDIPVNDYFWRIFQGTQSLLDFVVHMNLTLEQANLDYCLYYKKLMETYCDFDSAKVLEKVYFDEIGHVSLGVHWFRKWSQCQDSEWLTYNRLLRDPLSPQNAKGPIFSIDSRKKCGFKSDYITNLKLYRKSKSRKPKVYYANAFQSLFFKGLAFDLKTLLLFYAPKDDALLIKAKVSQDYLKYIDSLGIVFPETVTGFHNFLNYSFYDLCPVRYDRNFIFEFMKVKKNIRNPNSWLLTLREETLNNHPLFYLDDSIDSLLILKKRHTAKFLENLPHFTTNFEKKVFFNQEKDFTRRSYFDQNDKDDSRFDSFSCKLGSHTSRVFEYVSKGVLSRSSDTTKTYGHDKREAQLFKISTHCEVFYDGHVKVHGYTRKLSETRLFLGSVEEGDCEELKKFLYLKSHGSDFFSLLEDLSRKIAEYLKGLNYIGVFSFSSQILYKDNVFKTQLLEDLVFSFSFEYLSLKLKKYIKTGSCSYVCIEDVKSAKKKGFSSMKDYALFFRESSRLEFFQNGEKTLISKGKLILSDFADLESTDALVYLEVK